MLQAGAEAASGCSRGAFPEMFPRVWAAGDGSSCLGGSGTTWTLCWCSLGIFSARWIKIHSLCSGAGSALPPWLIPESHKLLLSQASPALSLFVPGGVCGGWINFPQIKLSKVAALQTHRGGSQRCRYPVIPEKPWLPHPILQGTMERCPCHGRGCSEKLLKSLPAQARWVQGG